ncbi:MAG TPA: PIG-L family deacetylase [Tepidisphaeraceae bacterium]|nr:PIG-L family deacetylase [Tepidisphaeraceae bacterium]
MKPTPTSENAPASLLAVGAHPDDIEFGCGGVVAKETRIGRSAHFVVCSQGEAASHGTPADRKAEAERAAAMLGASIEFLAFDGDGHLEMRVSHAIAIAQVIRRAKPSVVLAPTTVENQHPDHSRLGRLTRDAARLARYGGVEELRSLPPHAIDQLLFYAVTVEGEPRDVMPILVDVSEAEVMAAWTAAMAAHATQAAARNYVELQLTRAKLNGLRAGVGHAIALFANDPLVVDSVSDLRRAARRF